VNEGMHFRMFQMMSVKKIYLKNRLNHV